MNKLRKKNKEDDGDKIVFYVFCLWSIVLLCRPQNFIPQLLPFRPALTMSVVMLIFLIIYLKKINGPELFSEKQLKLYFALIFIFALSIPTALHVRVSFEFLFLDYIITVLFIVLLYKIINTAFRLRRWLLSLCVGSGLYFIMAVSSNAATGGRLAFSTTFDPNDLAYFALVFLPLNFLFMGKGNHILVRGACLILFASGLTLIFLTQSRGGFVALVVAFLVFLFWSRVISKSMKVFMMISGAVVIAIAPIDFDRFSTILNLEEDYNVQAETGRLAIWRIGFRTMIDNPLTGVGVRNYVRAVAQDREDRGLEVVKWQSPHNSLIQVGAETGFIGLFIYLFLSFNALRIFVKVRKQPYDQALCKVGEVLVIGFIGMFTASLFLSHGYSIYWAFYIGLSAVLSQVLHQQMRDHVALQKI